MPSVIIPVTISEYESQYEPRKVLNHPDFRVIAEDSDPALSDPHANLACAYNPQHEIHMVTKPKPTLGSGEVLVHVRATGICGCVSSLTQKELTGLAPTSTFGSTAILGPR